MAAKIGIHLAFIVVACVCFQLETEGRPNNPYSYNYFGRPYSADDYTSMGDISWVKRRGSPLDDGPVAEALNAQQPKRANYHLPYKYRQPYMQARRRVAAYQPYSSRGYSRYTRPQSRTKNGDRQYAYASMADMDWGWKKRSQLPAWLEYADADDVEDNVEEEEARSKKNVASLARANGYPTNHRFYNGKRSAESEDSMDDDLIEEDKRNIASIVRASRSGIASLARNGALRPS